MKRNDAGGMEWSDGSPATYLNWAPGEPSYTWGERIEDCVEVYDTGMWNDQTCSEKRPFVCKTIRPMVYIYFLTIMLFKIGYYFLK